MGFRGRRRSYAIRSPERKRIRPGGAASSRDRLQWTSESGAGVDADYVANSNTTEDLPAQFTPVHLAVTRISNVVQFYLNGLPWGLPSSALTTPAGGTSGAFNVSSGSNRIFGLKIIASGLTAAQIKAEYNRTMGVAFGALA